MTLYEVTVLSDDKILVASKHILAKDEKAAIFLIGQKSVMVKVDESKVRVLIRPFV